MSNAVSRRRALAATGMLCGGWLAVAGGRDKTLAHQLEPRTVGHDSGVRITGFEYFPVVVPWDEEEVRRGKMYRFGVVRITTTDGITGYAFGRIYPSWRDKRSEAEVVETIRPLLLGADPFAVEELLGLGLIQWGAVEHALWDIIGKAAGQPVHKLLGGSKTRTR